ncbi:hypothetical protein AWW67_12725 [Roseivirga seohaensis]|uniref:Uncharacterized protein n=1 Tax=Roseivirga seohaensis TaxID=1914963 RepID=A0A150XKG9_9BACT|nr:hypothetical protein [Roseivirga seohaensis]KYG79238.1 hypothetical protein AWW67_12725 [Roseivirga seohaensis]
MTKLVATGLLITYVIILFGYGAATAGHSFLHAIENPFHSHGHAHKHEHGHGHEEEKDESHHHEHDAVTENESHHAVDNDHDHVETQTNNNKHNIEDHTLGFNKLNSQDKDVSPTKTLNPLFIFVYTQANNLTEHVATQFKLSETEHHYLSLYKSLDTEPVTPPPPSIC